MIGKPGNVLFMTAGDSTDSADTASETSNSELTVGLNKTPIQESLTETRRILQQELDYSEMFWDDALRLVRLNLVLVGGLATLVYTAPDLVTAALPNVLAGGFFISVSLVISAYMYGNMSPYSGFGDSPDLNMETLMGDDNEEETNIFDIEYDEIIQRFDEIEAELPSDEQFRAAILLDHQKGIRHNGVGLRNTAEVLRRSSILIYIGIIMTGIGIGTELSSKTYTAILPISNYISLVFAVYGVHTTLVMMHLAAEQIDRLDDEKRFDYDHYGYDYAEYFPVWLAKLYKRAYRSYRHLFRF